MRRNDGQDRERRAGASAGGRKECRYSEVPAEEEDRASSSPHLGHRQEGVYSVNRRNELTWTLPLKPGEQRTLTYRYTTLVAN